MTSNISKFLFEKKGWIPLLFFILFIFFIIFAPSITTIIIVAFFVSYAISPLIKLFEKKLKLPRIAATISSLFLIFILILFLALLVLPVFIKEITEMIVSLPDLTKSALTWITEIANKLGYEIVIDKTSIMKSVTSYAASAPSLFDPVSNIFSNFFKQAFSVFSFIIRFFILLVITFFTSYNYNKITAAIISLFPTKRKDYIMTWIKKFDTILSGFIHGQLTVCFVLGSLYALGLTIAGLERGGSIGAMIGAFCIIPYAGLFTGLIIALLLGIINGGVLMVIKIVMVFGIIQTLDTIFITPNIMGKKVGISPVFVIIALLAGGEIGGILGILIAVPLFAILKIVIEEIIKNYHNSDFYNN